MALTRDLLRRSTRQALESTEDPKVPAPAYRPRPRGILKTQPEEVGAPAPFVVAPAACTAKTDAVR
jgi:hypothetical protein